MTDYYQCPKCKSVWVSLHPDDILCCPGSQQLVPVDVTPHEQTGIDSDTIVSGIPEYELAAIEQEATADAILYVTLESRVYGTSRWSRLPFKDQQKIIAEFVEAYIEARLPDGVREVDVGDNIEYDEIILWTEGERKFAVTRQYILDKIEKDMK